ncbi:Fungal specific transcription factor [Coniosporium apollinis]|uniref:Fungal specific transcription factor n=1 Tax=Coniosporium apollinis TaxID=61459 RepID=A0ABQ9P3E4_9PEZI|nr:Fungal specific transcription factor [Coniosporium apollinis]
MLTVASITPPASSPPKSPTIPRHFETLGETIGLQRSQHCRYIGPTTPYDSRIIGLAQFDKRNESSFNLGTLRRVTNNECFLMLSDDTTQEYGDEVEALRAVEQLVAPHGPALIDLYFRTVHPSFPIIQKQLYLERHRSGDQQLSPSLLAGIYILALNWWSSDPRLAPLPKPDTRKLEALASKWLASSMQRPKLSTVQAGLLLLQRPDADSWSLTTQLVAIGQELGLHLDCSNWSIPAWERGLRKRLAWALYMQDKWSSLIHGRPSHIFSANWAVRPNTDEDYEDERVAGAPRGDSSEEDKAEEERGQTHFAQMIALTRIMAEVMDTFYTQVAISDFEAAGKSSTRLILERAKPVQIKLKDWFAKLPASCKMDSLNGGRLSPNGTTASHPDLYESVADILQAPCI